jgi:hypothetical protein
MTAPTLSASTTTTPASRPSPKPNDGATKSRAGRPATHAALGDWGIPGGPEVYSTRCPPLPRLRMKESREIVHRAVLRAKGLDPDLVPSPSKSPDARGGGPYAKKKNAAVAAASGSPRAPPISSPRTDLREASASAKHTPFASTSAMALSSASSRLNEREDAFDLFPLPASEKDAESLKAAKRRQNRDLFLEDVELDLLLPKSRGGVGGGGGGDFTKGVGATHFLRVKHEVKNARLERRVRLALVHPEKAPEVDAVDVASEIPGVTLCARGGSARRVRRGADALSPEKRKPKAPSPYTTSGSSSLKNGKTVKANVKTRLAPSMAYAARVAAANAAGTVAFAETSAAIKSSTEERPFKRSSRDVSEPTSVPGTITMSPRAARVSASLRALVAEAPTHVAAAVDDVAAAAARAVKREVRTVSAKVRFLADARNAARDRNAKLKVELERLNDELVRVRRSNRGSESSSKASGTTTNVLRAEIEKTKTYAEEEMERAKTREHVSARLRETVVCLRRGVDATRDVIVECDADVTSCRAYADDALRSEQRAVVALEWIKKKYLLKANSWKKDLEAQKATRELIAEEVRELRAADRRRGARDARARQASEAFIEVQKEKEENEIARRDLESQSEDVAKHDVIRLAVAVGLGEPETRTPDAVVEAVRLNELRKAEALVKVEELQATEAEMWRVLLEKRETLRKTRLGLSLEESSELPNASSSSSSTKSSNDRDVEHRLGQAQRSLARKFKRFEAIAARLVAVDEGLKKIDDAVARTRARVGCSVARPGSSSERPGSSRRVRLSTLGRPPLAARSSEATAVERKAVAVDRKAAGRSSLADPHESRDSPSGPIKRASASARPSVGGRAAETSVKNDIDLGTALGNDVRDGDVFVSPRRRRCSAHVDSVAAERSSLAAASTTSPSRRSSTPASPSSSVGARPTSAASAASHSRPPRVSSRDPFGVFDRLSRPRASRTERTEPKTPSVETRDVLRRAETPTSRTRDASDESEKDALVATDAASAATRLLASALPARFENTTKAILEVLGSIPRGKDGSHARASVVFGGARDKVSGGLRGGSAGYPAAERGELSQPNFLKRTARFGDATRRDERDAHERERDALLRSLLCARPGKVPVAAGEVDDDPARMRLKRGRAYREMAMKWCFRAGRPIADEEDSGDELHAVAGEDGVLRFNPSSSTNGTSNASGEEGVRENSGALKDALDGVAPTTHALDPQHASGGGALDLARAANVGLSAAAFRRLVARTRKAGVVPTRADLKKASRRAEEKRARLLERAKRRAEEAEE